MWRTKSATARKASYYFIAGTQGNNEQKQGWNFCIAHIQIFGRAPKWQKHQRLFKQMNNKTCIIHCCRFGTVGNGSTRKIGSYPKAWNVGGRQGGKILPSFFLNKNTFFFLVHLSSLSSTSCSASDSKH